MSDEPEKPPEPTLYDMTDVQRELYRVKVGDAAYVQRLTAEGKGRRTLSSVRVPPPVQGIAPPQEFARNYATPISPELDVDLVAMSDVDRNALIRKHGIAAYSTALNRQLRGQHNFLRKR